MVSLLLLFVSETENLQPAPEHHHHPHPHSDPESESSAGAQPACPLKNIADSHANHRHAQRSFAAPGRDLGMMGALLHVLGDALNNVGVIVAAVVIWRTAPSPARFYADPAVGMAIALMILGSAVPLIKHSGEILLQSAPAGVDLGDIKHDIEKIPGVVSVHELRTSFLFLFFLSLFLFSCFFFSSSFSLRCYLF
jgi:zinc transporter 1